MIDNIFAPQDAPAGFTLAPSDFGYLWKECKRCFYLKVRRGLPRPATPFPGIFSTIHSCMRCAYSGACTSEAGFGPAGCTFTEGEHSVLSAPLTLAGHTARVVLRGRMDMVLLETDGAAWLADFKTGKLVECTQDRYWPQLNAYAVACENPAAAAKFSARVNGLGLLVFEPARFTHRPVAAGGIGGYLGGSFTWVPVARDDDRFMRFLGDVLTVLEAPDPPPAAPSCPFCRFAAERRRVDD